MDYNAYNSVLYLMARFVPEYAVLIKILGEISSRDPEFKPRSLFDFGSGVGPPIIIGNDIFLSISMWTPSNMNDLAQVLLQGGKGMGKMPSKGQFLPATKTTYDLVICAYSLFELPSMENRLQTMINLWNKTEKYLVIVEHGTNAGFKVINEIRDFLLDIKKESNVGHVFSPASPQNVDKNYIRQRSENDMGWPRIVRPALVRSKHTICRMCTANGKLEEVIFTASKHGKITYHCARASHWGDLLPVRLNSEMGVVESDNDRDKANDCKKF
ncbi:hypothetical protein NQ318_021976 [Aromia moschata]|uniref:Methyltransferase type 11 domain-containing protein n=1 Tax=Aromia moschata TaxID=1265417 RepID=A0AAV8Z5E7_9CUCU|nr:hypothetical protein NQ318_021976 [Aromia moschata]